MITGVVKFFKRFHQENVWDLKSKSVLFVFTICGCLFVKKSKIKKSNQKNVPLNSMKLPTTCNTENPS